MTYYIGIDGGGTKTIFCLLNEEGTVLSAYKDGSASYKQIGMEGVVALLEKGIFQLLKEADVSQNENIWTCFGMPTYGESRANDELMESLIKRRLEKYHIKLVNDCEVAWAGSLLLEPGINLVAGTGTIGFGKNIQGDFLSAGGWSEYFSDEGSGRWLGIKCLELFSKQADERLKKGPLYEIVKEYFSLTEDKEIIDLFEKDYQPYRSKIAFLQKLLLEAAKQGDQSAIQAYDDAAKELAMIIRTLYIRLKFHEKCPVSYSGGIFKTGELVVTPLKKYLSDLNITIVESQGSPWVGAGLLAKYYEDKKEPCSAFIREVIETDFDIL